MGLLDKLLKGKLSEGLQDAVKKVEEATGLDLTQDGKPAPSAQPQAASPAVRSAQAEPSIPPTAIDRAYFAEIIAAEFPQYTVRENISPSEFGGTGRNLDFGLYSGSTLAGVVVLVEHNRDNNRAYRGAKESCQRAGIPFINFYLHMPNKREFVVYRIGHMVRA